ncbi:hypothetical protein GQ53DRAFT_799192 [Thozetella sp. PMI_491]|nr:hypothetical protein GQ53DRAFT_799192 [Thozetella sp. PMI_491]
MSVRMDTSDPADLLRRACDQCRVRKIRCDRQVPCSNCTAAELQCASIGVGHKSKEARQRVLISTQYEKKIDHIEQRLGKIENVLGDVAKSQRRIEASTRPEPSNSTQSSVLVSKDASGAPVTRSSLSTRAAERTRLDTPLASDSSMAAHATFASEILEQNVEQNSLQDTNPTIRDALSSLQQLIHAQAQRSTVDEVWFAPERPLGSTGLRGLQLPPLDVVVNLLRELKEKVLLTFTLVCVLNSLDYFTEQCKKVYFATEDFSPATFILANAGLHYVFQEKTVLALHAGDKVAAARHQEHSGICRENLETALANLNALMPARKENIEALVMGASYAVETARPSLAWQLNALASQLCVVLGYHRATSLPGESEEAKKNRTVLFWMTYALDKGLALRLGRPSLLQDYDITLSRTLEPFAEFDDQRQTVQNWIVHAQVQGRVYEELYSPAALLRPAEQRLQTAVACMEILQAEFAKLVQARREVEKALSDGSKNGNDIEVMLLRSDEVAKLSTLTLVYRTIPPSGMGDSSTPTKTFCRECIDVAREAIQAHLECANQVEANPMLATVYLHWAMLFSPFVPFIVLFCHVIETSDSDGLRLLENFKSSLERWRTISDQVDRLYRLSQALHNVALLYVETRQAQNVQSPQGQESTRMTGTALGQECDTYLNQLGLLPYEDQHLNMEFDGSGTPAASSMDPHANEIGNWFSGYMNMARISEFTPPNGSQYQ